MKGSFINPTRSVAQWTVSIWTFTEAKERQCLPEASRACG